MKNKQSHKALTTIGLIGAISLSSCSSMSDSSVAQTQGTIGGATLGVLTGWGIAELLGLDSEQTEKLIVLTSTLGGALGNQWAKSVVKKKEAYAKTEDYLIANINQLNSRTKDVAELNEALVGQIKDIKAKKSTISATERANIQKGLKAKTSLISTDITTAKQAMSYASGDYKAQLESRIKSLESQRAALIKNTSTFMSISRTSV